MYNDPTGFAADGCDFADEETDPEGVSDRQLGNDSDELDSPDIDEVKSPNKEDKKSKLDKDEKTINNKLNTTDSTKKNLSQDEIKKMLKNGNFKETLRKNNGVLWENEKGDQIWFTGEEFRYRENGGKWTYNTKFTNPKKEEEKKQDTTEVFKEVNVYTIIDRDENRRQGVIVRFQDGNYSMLKYNDYTENNKIIQFEIEYYHKDSKKFKKHYYELIKPYDIDLTDKWTHHRSIFSSWYIKDSKKDCSELFNPIKKIMARIHFLNKKDWESFQELSPR